VLWTGEVVVHLPRLQASVIRILVLLQDVVAEVNFAHRVVLRLLGSGTALLNVVLVDDVVD
jgi:hypothetical protein